MDLLKFEFSHIELFFLSGILGSDIVIGLSDPFQGYLIEEIKPIWEKTKNDLIQKNVLYMDSDQMIINENIEPVLYAWCQASDVLWIKFTNGSSVQEQYIHSDGERIVIKYQSPTGEYVLEQVGEDTDLIHHYIQPYIHDVQDHEMESMEFKIVKSRFQQIYQMALDSKFNSIIDSLQDSNVPEKISIAFAEMLKHPFSELQVIAMSWSDHWEVNGLSYLQGERRNWTLRKKDKSDELNITTRTIDRFIDDTENILNSVNLMAKKL